MDFYQKYELLDLLKDEGVKVFNARETATGRRITVFLFVGDQARLQADLLEQLRASQRPGRPDLLEVGDAQGTPFVATEPLGGLADLKRIAVAAPAGKPPDAFTKVGVWHIPGPTAPAPAPVAPARGEFTGLFQAAAPPQPMGEAASPAPPHTRTRAALSRCLTHCGASRAGYRRTLERRMAASPVLQSAPHPGREG